MNLHLKASAVMVFQKATESYLVGLLKDINLCTIHVKRLTILSKDIQLVWHICGKQLWRASLGSVLIWVPSWQWSWMTTFGQSGDICVKYWATGIICSMSQQTTLLWTLLCHSLYHQSSLCIPHLDGLYVLLKWIVMSCYVTVFYM